MTNMTKNEAIQEIISMAKDKEPGRLTTTVCEALNIKFETFLRFSQCDHNMQLEIINNFALQMATEFFGHCSQ